MLIMMTLSPSVSHSAFVRSIRMTSVLPINRTQLVFLDPAPGSVLTGRLQQVAMSWNDQQRATVCVPASWVYDAQARALSHPHPRQRLNHHHLPVRALLDCGKSHPRVPSTPVGGPAAVCHSA
jgi:hypothetical protein